RLARAVGQFVHHLGEARPVDALPGLPAGAAPVDRTAADFQLAQLLAAGEHFQLQRGLRLHQLDVGELGEHPVLALRNPLRGHRACLRRGVCAYEDWSLEPKDYDCSALTIGLWAPGSRIMEERITPRVGRGGRVVRLRGWRSICLLACGTGEF